MAASKKKSKSKKKVESKSKAKAKAQNKSKAKIKARAKAKPKAKLNAQSQRKTKATSVVWNEFFTPLDDRLVVRVEKYEQTAGGLFIPATAGEKPQQGIVVAVGRGHRSKKGKLRPMDVKVGDEVLFSGYSGVEMKLHDQEILILREEEILGVMS